MTELNQSIGFFQGIGLLVTTLLGTGVFILPQVTAEIANKDAILAWILLGVAIIPITIVLAELGRTRPHPAGVSYYIEIALGKSLGKTSGLMFILLIPVGAPAALDMITQFLQSIVALSATTKLMAELGFILFMWLLNYRGVKASGVMQLALTIVMIAVILMLSIAASSAGEYQLTSSFTTPNWTLTTQAMAIAFWSFMGIEALTHLSTEFRNPKRDFMPAMILGTVLVAIIYIVSTWLVLPVVSSETLSIISVFNNLMGNGGYIIIGVLGIASGFATVNVYATGISRLAWSYAADGVLPKGLKKLNSHQVPMNSFSAIVAMITIMVLAKHTFDIPFETLILWANGVVILIYLLTMIAAIKLLSSIYKVWAYIGCAVSALIVLSIGMNMLYALIMFTLVLAYLFYSKKFKAKEQPAL